MHKTLGINHLGLSVRNLDQTLAFFLPIASAGRSRGVMTVILAPRSATATCA